MAQSTITARVDEKDKANFDTYRRNGDILRNLLFFQNGTCKFIIFL